MTDDSLRNPELLLSLSYAPATARPALSVLWRLDEVLASIVQTTSEPMIGQMRLTWWHGALAALETAPPPAEPLLADIASMGLIPGQLLPLVEGWEVLLDPLPWDGTQLASYAEGRGAAAFQCAATLLGGDASPAILAAGRGWALADLAFHCSDRATAEAALSLARPQLANAPRHWPANLRSIGMLTVFAARDVAAGLDQDRGLGSPRRVLRALRHRITGR